MPHRAACLLPQSAPETGRGDTAPAACRPSGSAPCLQTGDGTVNCRRPLLVSKICCNLVGKSLTAVGITRRHMRSKHQGCRRSVMRALGVGARLTSHSMAPEGVPGARPVLRAPGCGRSPGFTYTSLNDTPSGARAAGSCAYSIRSGVMEQDKPLLTLAHNLSERMPRGWQRLHSSGTDHDSGVARGTAIMRRVSLCCRVAMS